MARIKAVDLMRLSPQDGLWDTLKKMTLKKSYYFEHSARNMLRRLRRQLAGYKTKLDAPENGLYSHADAILLMEDGEVMAYNIIIKERECSHRILHAYTKRKYRRLGYQKRLLKYTSKKFSALYFWTNTKARERTFAYYTGARRVD